MANKIAYANKVGVVPKAIHINQVWDDDMNEIKTKHNLNDDRITAVEASTVLYPTTGAELQAFINANRVVYLLPITYTITTTISIPDNTKIIGVRGATKILAGNNSMTSLFSIVGGQYITIENISFEGYSVNSTTLTNLAEVKAKTGMGIQSGIYITRSDTSISGQPYYITMRGLSFLNFTKAGLHCYVWNLFRSGIKMDSCYFDYCYIGLYLDRRAEYGQYSNLTMNDCQIGLWCDAGNVIFEGIQCNYNQVGAVWSGMLDDNDSHNEITVSQFNHNELYAIVVTTVSLGLVFVGCHAGGSKPSLTGCAPIYVDDSRGFNYNGGLLLLPVIFHPGAQTRPGQNQISNSIFLYSYVVLYGAAVTVTAPSTVLLKNNYFIAGEATTAINN